MRSAGIRTVGSVATRGREYKRLLASGDEASFRVADYSGRPVQFVHISDEGFWRATFGILYVLD